MLTTFIFTIAHMVKGAGWLFKIPAFASWYESWSDKVKSIVSFKLMSCVIVLVYCSIIMSPLMGLAMTAAWIAAVSLPIRDDALAVGRIGYWSGAFKDAGYSRMSSIIRAIMRGVWMGAMFTMVLGKGIILIPMMGLGFIAAYFIGQEIHYRLYKTESWTFAEPIMGAIMGLAIGMTI